MDTIVQSDFLRRCIAIDLEVAKDTGKIYRFAAIRGDAPDNPFTYAGGELEKALNALDAFAEGAEFLLGHNIIAFDIPRLREVAPNLHLLSLPAVDTLRLSPLAFPRNPYHHLVKHYKDGGLYRFSPNDPELDSRICMELFADEAEVFHQLKQTDPNLFDAFHWLTSSSPPDVGFARLFHEISGSSCPAMEEGKEAVSACLLHTACVNQGMELLNAGNMHHWAMAYALAWLSVAGGNSVMPPWVRHEFPDAARLVRKLRDMRCADPECAWCREHHNPEAILKHWFGYSAFRPEPACDDGSPMQRAIVEASMQGKHVLGILPTGTGKSICYQIPALSRYENTGALTVVISPLVALMEDQVHGLQEKGVNSCFALNGLLSMPERSDVLEKVRLGDAAILLVSPEQLRNPGFRKAVQQREIGAWVLDEAHCLSKWGHDFRTDYRYVGRFIKESAGKEPLPPVLCLTATAKPDVITDIRDYFKNVMGVQLRIFNGGANRTNLDYRVVETTPAHRLSDLHQLLKSNLPADGSGGAIIYCATRKNTEVVAKSLKSMGWSADYFHAGLTPENKKNVQQQFIRGDLRVIAATNAFGMGIDKPDVRLVIHAEMPGSLENYVQEAGRAGRDQKPALCILMHCEKDIEQQFGLSRISRLQQNEIQAVLKALRRCVGKHHPKDDPAEIHVTPGEILVEDEDNEFQRDSNTEDTRVRTAISWLENARLVSREQNLYNIYPSTLRIPSLKEADERLEKFPMPFQGQLRAIVKMLLDADPTTGVTTDELMGVSRLSSSGVRNALHTLEQCGILSNDSIFTALVHVGVENASRKRLENCIALEKALIAVMQELAPDLQKDNHSLLSLRRATQHLKNDGYEQTLPGHVLRLLRGIASDGRSEDEGIGSIRLNKVDAEYVRVTLQRDWESLKKTAELRRTAASLLLEHLVSCVPPETRGIDLLSTTTLGELHAAVESDMELKGQIKDVPRLTERAMLWLHEQEIARLGRGMVVFRPAMYIRIAPGNKPFTQNNYEDLKKHYDEQVVQIHVMAEYARQGLQDTRSAIQLTSDYFTLSRENFIGRWFPKAAHNLSIQTGKDSFDTIVGKLNRVQREIVTDDREKTNVLVLAGPGSGKTRVLVHRIAYLVRVRRENPRGILALAYNRHAVAEIRRRLHELIDDDANGVTVLTCHALAMRLTGTSFAEDLAQEIDFGRVLTDAVRLLKGEGMVEDDADEQRERLLAGFRWILVDEYQDIGEEQYELISALAGRTLNDPEKKLSLFAVGDDDQNVYAFAGASVKYIRKFQEDYKAKPVYLTENYRSTTNIIATANAVITRAGNRMKIDKPIKINEARQKEPFGGSWERIDPVTKGRVHLLNLASSPAEQAEQVMRELVRLSSLDKDWNWSNAAVIARQWKYLQPVRAFCELNKIPTQMADQDAPQFWRLRETQSLKDWLAKRGDKPISADELDEFIKKQAGGPWWELLEEAIENYRLECGTASLPANHLKEWLAEWGREIRKQQRGLMLSTAHRTKGLEFDHVAILDGSWDERGQGEDTDAARRLYYVAMTRARKTLLLASANRNNQFHHNLWELPTVYASNASVTTNFSQELERQYKTLTPSDIDLGYAGRLSPGSSIHKVLQRLQAGDSIELVRRKDRWFLEKDHVQIGYLAKNYKPPEGMRCIEARVHAILVRFRQDSDPTYADRIKCDQWETVLPELIFA